MNEIPTRPNPAASRPPAPAGGTVRIMVLSDDDIDLELTRRCAQAIPELQVELTGCQDVASALGAVGSEAFDVVLIDDEIGEMAGLEALDHLTEAGCRAPAILITGRRSEHLLHGAFRTGFLEYLPKDHLSPALLAQMIRSALAKAKLTARFERKQEEMECTIESLVKRSQELEGFYHCVGHELRTPLTGAREFVSLMQDGAAGPLTASQSSLLAAAVRNCDQMVRCVDDMLDTARIETGKLVLTSERHDLVAVVRDAIQSVRATDSTKRIEFRLKGMGAPVHGVFDCQRIYQVVANLTSNAMKFTPARGIISVGIQVLDSEAIQVRVDDSGPGIPEGDELLIFDRLYQSSAKDAALLGGLGMGLYISQEIVELHGGDISYARSPLGGAQITFTLPQRSTAGDRERCPLLDSPEFYTA